MTSQEADRENVIRLRIHRMAHLLLGNYHDAWDLSQEVFLELEKGRRKWERAQSKWAWAAGVFHRQFKRFLRLRKRHRCDPLVNECPATAASVEERAMIDEQLTRTLQALQRLDKEIAEALVLFSFEKTSIKDIARIQQVAEGTVKWRIFEARRRLMGYLNDQP